MAVGPVGISIASTATVGEMGRGVEIAKFEETFFVETDEGCVLGDVTLAQSIALGDGEYESCASASQKKSCTKGELRVSRLMLRP